MTVNTIRSALGADPIDLSPDATAAGSATTPEDEAKALAERFKQMQQATHQ